MKKIILLLLFIPAIIYCQNTHEINFKITDTLVIKKNYPFATKVNLEINIQNFQNKKIFLYSLNKCVIPFFFNFQMGIAYIVEDKNHEIIKCQSDAFSILYPYPSPEDKRNQSIGIFVNSKQKIISKKLSPKQKKEYNLAKLEVNSPQQEIALYLLLSAYHSDLPKGDYYLYLTYSFKPGWQYVYKEIVNDMRTFKGSIVSNKVKLIVE